VQYGDSSWKSHVRRPGEALKRGWWYLHVSENLRGSDDWLQDQWLQLDKFPTRCRDVRGVGLAIGQDHNSDPGLSTDEGTRYKVQVFYAGRLSASLQSGNPFLTPKVKAKQFFVTPIIIQHSTRVHFQRLFRCSTTRLETRKSGLIFLFFADFVSISRVTGQGSAAKLLLALPLPKYNVFIRNFSYDSTLCLFYPVPEYSSFIACIRRDIPWELPCSGTR
jgi:hypothetical protein